MKSYAERNVFSDQALRFYRQAVELVSWLGTHSDLETREIRCHELARALGEVLELEVVDGASVGVDHSWLIIDRTTILDPYAPGRHPMVQLVDLGTPTLLRLCYAFDGSGKTRDDIRDEVVRALVWEMRKVHVRAKGPV